MNLKDIPADQLQAAEEGAVGLAVIGVVIDLQPIKGADFIVLAAIDCAIYGKWSGVVPATSSVGDPMLVLLQDAVLPPDERWAFMEKHHWRVRMARFKKCASECVALPATPIEAALGVGTDVTQGLGVTKHTKPLPKEMAGIAKGSFPSRIPKTDETNFQGLLDLSQLMVSSAWYVTEKADGTSCTAYVLDGELHVCSRNLELVDGDNLYWRMAREQGLSSMPNDTAIQFEIVGPGVQGNPMGLEKNEIRVFTGYLLDAPVRRMTYDELQEFCAFGDLKMARFIGLGAGSATPDALRLMADVKYDNSQPAEGIVIRAMDSSWSFKVLNLLYKD